jgi:hypothetical protein
MTFGDFVTDYWQILTALVSVIYTFAHLKSQNEDQEKRLCKLEGRVDDMSPVFMEIKERLASIEATLKSIIK